MIQKLALIAKILIILTGAFFILMGFDVFGMDEYTIWERMGGFFVSISPGLIMIAVTLIFWTKERPLGFMAIGIALVWLIFLIIRGNFPEMIGGVLIVDIPLILAGTVLILSAKKQRE